MPIVIRRQLTLFINKIEAENIENIRRQFNPIQSKLLDSHVTLCREDEIENIEQVLNNLSALKQKALSIIFGPAIRFDNGPGVFMEGTTDNIEFHELRGIILKNVIDNIKLKKPHVTLMHPRNSTCTDGIFEIIKNLPLPKQLYFKTIFLIEQVNGGQWKVLKQFDLPE